MPSKWWDLDIPEIWLIWNPLIVYLGDDSQVSFNIYLLTLGVLDRSFDLIPIIQVAGPLGNMELVQNLLAKLFLDNLKLRNQCHTQQN